jgi:acetate kinase
VAGVLGTVCGRLAVAHLGIGEHAPAIRTEICGGLGHLGVRLDEARNAGDDPVVSADGASCVVRIVPAREELVIARHTARTALSSQPA